MGIKYISWTFDYNVEGWFNILSFSSHKNVNSKYTILKEKFLLVDELEPDLYGPNHIYKNRMNLNMLDNDLLYYYLVEKINTNDGKRTYRIGLTTCKSKLTLELEQYMCANLYPQNMGVEQKYRENNSVLKLLKKNNSGNYLDKNGNQISIIIGTKNLANP